jgi:hypothetical protein
MSRIASKTQAAAQSMTWLLSPLLAATLALSACGGGSDAGPAQGNPGAGRDANAVALRAALQATPAQALSAAEAQGLAMMREEEQLAQAVYIASAQRWTGVPVFANIAQSEATHTAAVKTLLDRYALPDPLAGVAADSFPTPAFQALYAQLTATSALSLVDALKVGVLIEEMDIADLAAHLAASDNADIALVYGNLMRGSRNHLRAYVNTLRANGGSYTPVYLSQAEFDSIVNSARETGY